MEEVQKKPDKNSFRKIGDNSLGKVIVHTMPKRFLGIKPTVKKTKNVGMIIILSGIVFMIAGFLFFYFYLMQPSQVGTKLDLESLSGIKKETSGFADEEEYLEDEEEEDVIEEEVFENNSTEEDNEIKKIIIESDDVLALSTASSTIETEEVASSTDIIENEEDKIFKLSMDSDGDGLGDLEEILLDCNLTSSDSDGDGYSDLSELINIYNPAGNGQLTANPNISKYSNNSQKYSLLYPTAWQAEKVGTDESIIFKIGNNQFVQIIVQAGKDGQNIENWYKEQFNVNVIEDSQIVDKDGWTGVKSKDGLIFYLKNYESDDIFIVSYNIGLSDVLNFKNIFDVMIKTLELTI